MAVQAPPGKYQTPRVPIQTPLLGQDGKLDRTWVIFLEKLGRLSSEDAIKQIANGQIPPDYEYATWAIFDTTVGTNVTNLLPVRRGGTLVDCEIVPKTDTTGDFEIDILANAGDKAFSTRASIFATDKLFVPSGTPKGTIITQDVFRLNPVSTLSIDDILSADILTGGSADVFSVVLKWQVATQTA